MTEEQKGFITQIVAIGIGIVLILCLLVFSTKPINRLDEQEKLLKEFNEVMLAQNVTLTAIAGYSISSLEALGVNHQEFTYNADNNAICLMGNHYDGEILVLYKSCVDCSLKIAVFKYKDKTLGTLERQVDDIDLEEAVKERKAVARNQSLWRMSKKYFKTDLPTPVPTIGTRRK